MLTDPIADYLTRIRNGLSSGLATVDVPSSKLKRNLAALLKHVSEDKLVLWGWNPGGERQPVPVPHGEFVAKFKLWVDAGAPCPAG